MIAVMPEGQQHESLAAGRLWLRRGHRRGGSTFGAESNYVRRASLLRALRDAALGPATHVTLIGAST